MPHDRLTCPLLSSRCAECTAMDAKAQAAIDGIYRKFALEEYDDQSRRDPLDLAYAPIEDHSTN